MRPLSARWLIPVVFAAVLLSACGEASDETADTTLAPATTTAAATTPTIAPTTTVAPVTTTTTTIAVEMVTLPGPGEPWDLLFFGQEDLFTRQLPDEYAAVAADELGVEVRSVQPPGFDYVYAANMSGQLQGAYPPVDQYVPPAEIIVLLSRPGNSGDGSDDYIADDFERCWWTAPAGEPPTTNLPVDYWDKYRSDLDDIYTELRTLRQDTPTVLRTIDLYNPSLPQQRQGGIEAECTAWFEAMTRQTAEAAADNGSVFVSLYDLFNGPDHDQDPAEAGYIGPTDLKTSHVPWYQATETGVDLIAQRLADEGFEPTSRP